MAKHRAFNAHKFLDKFQGHEHLIRGYVGMWNGSLAIDAAALDVPAFEEYLLNGEDDGKDELFEDLYRAYDLCTERGHEDLVEACAEYDEYDPDPDGELPVECLSLKVRTEHEDAFNLAYARNTLWQAERFTIYRGREIKAIDDVPAAADRLQRRLADVFKADKKSDRVLVRQYREGPRTNFIVYHEKRTKAELTFKHGSRTETVSPTVFRPAQQDFISYDHETGQVEIEARIQKEEAALRRSFAECCLGIPDLFEDPDAQDRIDLTPIADDDFKLEVQDGHVAALVGLHFNVRQAHFPSLILRSKNVLATLDALRLRRRIAPESIRRAVIKITFPDDLRGKRIEIAGSNSVKFKRVTHAEDVFAYLRAWKLLRA